MNVISVGPAAFHVETADQRILIGPVFAQTPAGRADFDQLPVPTALFITCCDVRYFHPAKLHMIPKDLPVFLPQDAALQQELESLGFSRLSICVPWKQVELGETRLIPTPSSSKEPKLGVAIFSDGSFHHFSPDASAKSQTPPDVPSDIDLLRRHETTAVLRKKVLLSILAMREASRLGFTVTDAEVLSLSDWFRRRFGLADAKDMKAWLDKTGLDAESFLRVMYGFASVSKVQENESAEIESLVGIYAKVASIRNEDQ
jgi:hypothetical protein